MAAKGTSLQSYNNELVKCIEDLREKREELNRAILRDEEEKAKIQKVRKIFLAAAASFTSLHTHIAVKPFWAGVFMAQSTSL